MTRQSVNEDPPELPHVDDVESPIPGPCSREDRPGEEPRPSGSDPGKGEEAGDASDPEDRYPSAAELVKYFEEYAAHFELRSKIRFRHRVESALPLDGGGWRVEVEDYGPREYSALVIATGQCTSPRWPKPAVRGEFAGEQLHVFDYLDAPVGRVGAPFSPVPFSPGLEKFYVPNAETIVTQTRALLGL